MKWPFADRYLISSSILILLAVLYLGVVSLTDRRDMTSAMVIICATILFLTGILLFTFSRPESLDNEVVSLLAAQGNLNLCRVAADLGISGNACFLPTIRTGEEEVMQLMPVTGYSGGSVSGDSFVSGPGGAGILIPPSGRPLLHHLKKNNLILIPGDREGLSFLLRELAEEVLEIADSVQVSWGEETLQVRIDGYRLISGCRSITRESPACCTMNPCPFCSLLAICIGEGTAQPVRVDSCRPEQGRDTVHLTLTLLA